MALKSMKTLGDINVKGKAVLLRLDLNGDVRKGRVIESERFTAPLKTLKELQKKGAKTVILAHQGRPGSNDFISLKQHAKILSKYVKIKFVNDVIGNKAIGAIKDLKDREILLLDNARFVRDEMDYAPSKENNLINKLLPLFDFYVNDAFSASHRNHASIIGFPRFLESAIGRTFEEELKNAEKLNVKNALLILGGIKPEDYVGLIEKTKGKILPTGYLAILCFKEDEIKLGNEENIIKPFLPMTKLIKRHKRRFLFPVDLAVEGHGKRYDLKKDDFPSRYPIYDMGKESINLYLEEIKKAKTIFFKGLPGLCHNKSFTYGTETLLRAVANSKAFSVIGGGHTLTMIEKLNIKKKKFSYISLSGGALIYYLANGTLPGISALKKN